MHYAPGAGGVSFRGKGFPTELPCGYCVGCRKEQARQWATRCMHEASMHPENCFITLTYDDEHLPWPPQVSKRDHQLFMKKLRRRLPPAKRISFFLCSEYGDRNGRPHYHAIIFGFWPRDAAPWKQAADGSQLYTSAFLADVWGNGFTSVGAVTFGSALYVAGYVVQKQLKLDRDPGAYTWLDPVSGELICIEPEYLVQSRRPAIGKRWIERYGESDAYRHDKVVSRGVEAALPRYYDKQLAKLDPIRAEAVKRKRMIARARRGRADETKARRRVREVVEKARLTLHNREDL